MTKAKEIYYWKTSASRGREYYDILVLHDTPYPDMETYHIVYFREGEFFGVPAVRHPTKDWDILLNLYKKLWIKTTREEWIAFAVNTLQLT